jgi:hypothetical protein
MPLWPDKQYLALLQVSFISVEAVSQVVTEMCPFESLSYVAITKPFNDVYHMNFFSPEAVGC